MDKSILKSKTFWVNLIAAIAPLIPSVKEFIVGNPEAVMMSLGTIGMVLRLVTKGKVVLLP